MPESHTCSEFCSQNVTPALLNAHGFPTEEAVLLHSMGSVIKIVKTEGRPFRESKLEACLTAGSPFHICGRGLGNYQPRPHHTSSPEMLEWALAARRERARA